MHVYVSVYIIMMVAYVCMGPHSTLTADEIGAINLYTQETSLYKVLNAHLRAVDRSALKPYMLYLRLLVSALRKLPFVTTTLFRGVKRNFTSEFKQGHTVV